MGRKGEHTYGVVRYVDYHGEVHEEGVYFAWKETWKDTLRGIERLLRRRHGGSHVKKVVWLNGNAA